MQNIIMILRGRCNDRRNRWKGDSSWSEGVGVREEDGGVFIVA